MNISNQRTHVVLPSALIEEIDKLVGKRKRSSFLNELAARELKRLRLLKALDNAVGSWKDKDHPELKNGSATWIRNMRKHNLKRMNRILNYHEAARE